MQLNDCYAMRLCGRSYVRAVRPGVRTRSSSRAGTMTVGFDATYVTRQAVRSVGDQSIADPQRLTDPHTP
ncbi:hypothetical protein HNQ79_005565 [Streptomyces candidus]|uniref:Uncharacterized protein n=1 Tax=Streptomyces candidus TaxID=67283 RepID=A0A7X0HKA6_9ACTN|nr:hypothetical protein [Streptomyces candidus]GHH55464.1 hypothetical protein GCM10018773_59920 [Streptomyces candidus]